MLRRSLMIILAASFLIGGAVSAQTTSGTTTDEVEGAFNLSILVDGETLTDSFVGEVGTRLYGFQGTEGDIVTITMTQITQELDPFLVLLGPNGEVVASDDDSGVERYLSAAITEVTLPATGSYFIFASSFTNIDTILDEVLTVEQEFTLTLDGITAPADESIDPELLTITAFTAELGMVYEGETTVTAPVTYYIFTAEEGDSLDLVIDEADFDTILHLFDAEGNRIAVNDDDEDLGVLTSAIRGFEAPYSGSYLLMATDVFFYNALAGEDELLIFSGGTYSLSISGE